jgi:hypothetical protein
MEDGAAERQPRDRSAPRKKQGKGKKAAGDGDEAVFEEYAKIVEGETAQLPPAAAGLAEGTVSRKASARTRASRKAPQIRFEWGFDEAAGPRPMDAVFLHRGNHDDVGLPHDPDISTTMLRCLLLALNDQACDDTLEVVTMEGQVVPTNSTLGEQGVMPGARLQLAHPRDLTRPALS